MLASLADTLMPDAYKEGGKWVTFVTAAGFLLAFLIAKPRWSARFGLRPPLVSTAAPPPCQLVSKDLRMRKLTG